MALDKSEFIVYTLCVSLWQLVCVTVFKSLYYLYYLYLSLNNKCIKTEALFCLVYNRQLNEMFRIVISSKCCHPHAVTLCTEYILNPKYVFEIQYRNGNLMCRILTCVLERCLIFLFWVERSDNNIKYVLHKVVYRSTAWAISTQ